MAGLDAMTRAHVEGNFLDEIVKMRNKLDQLERQVMQGQIGIYAASTVAPDGHLIITLFENGEPVQYRVPVDKV